MIRLLIQQDHGDDCDSATLVGIVRRALLADDDFRAHADFTGPHDLLIAAYTDDGLYTNRTALAGGPPVPVTRVLAAADHA